SAAVVKAEPQIDATAGRGGVKHRTRYCTAAVPEASLGNITRRERRRFSVQALFHLDTRACRTIQQSFEVEACELVFRLLSEVSRKRRNGAWIAGCELGKSTQVTLGRGFVGLFTVKGL